MQSIIVTISPLIPPVILPNSYSIYQWQCNIKGQSSYTITIDLAEFYFAELLIQISTAIDRVDNFDDFHISKLYDKFSNNKPICHYFEIKYNHNHTWIIRQYHMITYNNHCKSTIVIIGIILNRNKRYGTQLLIQKFWFKHNDYTISNSRIRHLK